MKAFYKAFLVQFVKKNWKSHFLPLKNLSDRNVFIKFKGG